MPQAVQDELPHAGKAKSLAMLFLQAPGMQPEYHNYTAEWIKVEYDDAKQADRCRAILDVVSSILDDQETARALLNVDSHEVLGYSRCRTIVEELLLDEIVGFKKSAFQEEQEWRIVIRPRELLKQGADDGGKTQPRLFFRSSRGIVVPYVRLLAIEDRLPIRRIRFGPSLEPKRTKASVEALLEAHGFRDVEVDGSDIPVKLGLG
jgi:hypothetical protein